MRNKYLTKPLKKRYMHDFNNNVLKYDKVCDGVDWRVDEEIKDILININKNENIQTLYSNFGKPLYEGGLCGESYIKFAYTKKVELSIFRNFISVMTHKYFSEGFNGVIFNYTFEYPYKNLQKNKYGEMACRYEDRYFYINQITISIISNFKDVHESFWKDVNQKLSKINN